MDDPNLSVPPEWISHLARGLLGRKPAWRGASATVSSSMDALHLHQRFGLDLLGHVLGANLTWQIILG
jgi:hypothetical protein